MIRFARTVSEAASLFSEAGRMAHADGATLVYLALRGHGDSSVLAFGAGSAGILNSAENANDYQRLSAQSLRASAVESLAEDATLELDACKGAVRDDNSTILKETAPTREGFATCGHTSGEVTCKRERRLRAGFSF